MLLDLSYLRYRVPVGAVIFVRESSTTLPAPVGKHNHLMSQQQITPLCDRSFLGTHPSLFHQHQPREYKQKYNVLSLAAYSPESESDSERTQTYSVELSVTSDTHEASEQTLQMLNAIGR
mmetsp:Transcript_20360/g.30659  ORF Transcript_20360/g.30659 Transcript_20360/m.30659 type:complete len:120 (+) Transcript_20360:264-623(+)